MHFAKPENALKRAEELCAVGQRDAATSVPRDGGGQQEEPAERSWSSSARQSRVGKEARFLERAQHVGAGELAPEALHRLALAAARLRR